MATTRGCAGVVNFGSTPTAVGEVTDVSVNKTADRIETTAMDGTCTKKYQSGAVETLLSIRGYFDDADAGQQEIAIGTSLDFQVAPRGETAGYPLWSGAGNVQNHNYEANVNGVWTFGIEVTVNGDITEGTVPP